jgi:pimeloyl-ACP methyl ester carboxylesterase
MQFAAETASGVIVGEYAPAGGEPALILHGGPGMSDYTEPLADELSRSFRAIRYQQRGKSPSTTAGPLTVEAHVADAFAVLDELRLERAWVVGHSWGGHLAMHVAAAEPQRVSGLVAVGTLGASRTAASPRSRRPSRDVSASTTADRLRTTSHSSSGGRSSSTNPRRPRRSLESRPPAPKRRGTRCATISSAARSSIACLPSVVPRSSSTGAEIHCHTQPARRARS